ncbi:MAG: hypothetical protein JW741_04790 [Sedimentisphaerales bacterium]|nr:hypothetical protein [Sedimentisphaerales bacterium]
MKTVRFSLTRLILVGLAGWFLTAPLAAADESARQFELEEFSVFEVEGPLQYMLRSGQYARDCGDEPDERVKAYPSLKSAKPVYGSVPFAMDMLDFNSGQIYCFVLDESGGAGSGYDRLYFDANHDFDLSNDRVLKPAEDLPEGFEAGRGGPQEMVFESADVRLVGADNETLPPLTVWPRVLNAGSRQILFFVVPTARRGKITLGSKEMDVILAQTSVVTGRYDHPSTGLYLDNQRTGLGVLSDWPEVDGTLYRIFPTPAGDKVTVRAYDGAFGTLEVRSSSGTPAKIDRGWFQGEGIIIDVAKCSKEGSRLSIPVGDYRPYFLSVLLGNLRAGIRAKIPEPREKSPPVVLGLHVREGQPCVFKLDQKPDVVFQTPELSERLEPGQEVQIKAVMVDSATNLMLSGLEDTTRKVGEPLRLSGGIEYQRYESIDPVIKIADAAGETVAEGKMPFG